MVNILQAIANFTNGEINQVYSDCYFQLIEERTAIIYSSEEPRIYIHISVDKDDDSHMYVTDIVTEQCVLFSAIDGKVQCDDDRIEEDMANDFVARYLNLMEIFVKFTAAEE